MSKDAQDRLPRMAKMRIAALYCFSCLIASLSVRTSGAAESTPLPLPSSETALFSMDIGLWRVFLALLILFAVILLIRWSVRRSSKNVGRGEKDKSIEILERKVLGPKQSLLLVRVCGKKVLLHQGKGSFTSLCEIEESEEAPLND
ncbi:MAG: FliO/MopB family protein [Phycisphaerae bacterium]|jgi:flagellar biogenesis protein FliO|nr:FliO/MopB family protein [Phycisphaerae bacterium]MBT6269372.1 FliO/MopB family protein [Phycisphaerae bacterium]